MEKPRQVFFTCDHRFIDPLRVVVRSLLENATPGRPLTIFVAHNGKFTETGCRERLDRVVSAYPFAHTVFLDADDILGRNDGVFNSKMNGLSPIIWAGPLLSELLPENVHGNVVYMDVDMLVTADLEPLYALDLPARGMLAAAAIEGERGRFAYLEACGWPKTVSHYYNNGTLVVDIDAYRRERIAQKIIDWYATYHDRAIATDQDSQNAVFGDRILPLPPKWNYNDGWVSRLPKISPFAKTFRGLPAVQVLEAVVRPCIIHYINRKPWTFTHRPERGRYHRHMKELGLFDSMLNGETASQRLSLLFYDLYYGLIKLYARVLLAIRRG